jgi:hypothetical protein
VEFSDPRRGSAGPGPGQPSQGGASCTGRAGQCMGRGRAAGGFAGGDVPGAAKAGSESRSLARFCLRVTERLSRSRCPASGVGTVDGASQCGHPGSLARAAQAASGSGHGHRVAATGPGIPCVRRRGPRGVGHWQGGIWVPALPPRYLVSDLRYRTSHSISKRSISNVHSMSTFCTFDIVCRHRRCSISKV